MATNEVYHDAQNLSLPVTAGTKSGSPVLVGAIVGVAVTDEGAGGNPAGSATVRTTGAFNLPVKAAADLSVGAPVYIKSDGTLADGATGNTLFGYALEALATGTGTIHVKIA